MSKSKYFYNSYENIENNEEYSILNILLNLMDIRFAYENSILYNSFYQGIEILFENIKEYENINIQNKVIDYVNELIHKEKKLKILNKKYKNIKECYDLIQRFSSIKNIDKYLNIIIMKNMKIEQSINKIRNVLNDENNYNGNSNTSIYKKQFMEEFLNRNKSYNIDKFSFYTTNYYNSNNSRNNNFMKKSPRHIKTNSAINIKKMIKTNNYIQNKNTQYMNIKKKSSKRIKNKRPTNFNRIYSYSVSNNSKGTFNFNS